MSSISARIEVRGTPAPQGSKRHVGRGVMIESSAKVKPWREAVKWAAIEQGAAKGLDGPLIVEVNFYLRRPKRAKPGAYPDRLPDLDKLLRSTFDGLTEAGVWTDDARVVRVIATKWYEGDPMGMQMPGARILVYN